MPTFYEGAPIAEITFQISREDFIEAYFEKKNNRSFFSKKEIKGGIFISLILLTALTIPRFLNIYGSFFIPAVWILLFLFLLYYFVCIQPNEICKEAGILYDTNAFLQLETKAMLYRDSLIYENAYEKYIHYLTDFSCCMEDKNKILLIGGKRDLLVVKKEGMDELTVKKLQENLSSFFTSNYIFIK